MGNMWSQFIFTIGIVHFVVSLRPLKPHIYRNLTIPRDAGDALYLTPYINNGEIEKAQELSRIVDTLVGIDENEQPDMYSGYFTVNEKKGNHLFFWFIPATETDQKDAPLVMWLQGGPGASSLFGLLEVNGHFRVIYDEKGEVTAKMNPDSWCKTANMIYVDNPVGAGFSYTENPFTGGLPTTQDDIGDDLYEFLLQFFAMFPHYQEHNFFVFGESYAGKYVPTISRRIHEENQNDPKVKINLKGLGIGDGWMSPPHSAIYAEYLHALALLDDAAKEHCLQLEEMMKKAAKKGDYHEAWKHTVEELDNYILDQLGCDYVYGIDVCKTPEEEDNYEDYVNLQDVRKAIHVGTRPFGFQSSLVFDSLIPKDFMKSGMDHVEFLLDLYPFLIYDGNFDIICNHYGILQMFKAMETWSLREEFFLSKSVPYRVNGKTAGYLKSVGNLRMLVIRNAGHMVPRNQGEFSLEMFSNFIYGQMK